MLTKGTVLEFTKVMQLYEGLNINQKKDVVVQIEELPRNGSVKLVNLKMGQEDATSSFPLSWSANEEKMAQTEDNGGTSSSQQSVLSTETKNQASPANKGTESPSTKTSRPALEMKASPSVAKKAGKREHFKKIFTSLFTRAPNEILADEEDEEKKGSEDDIETTNPNQGTPANAPGETSNAESPLRSEKDNKHDVQLKLVDMGGHSATMVLTIYHFTKGYFGNLLCQIL